MFQTSNSRAFNTNDNKPETYDGEDIAEVHIEHSESSTTPFDDDYFAADSK